MSSQTITKIKFVINYSSNLCLKALVFQKERQSLSLENVTDFVEYEDLQGLPQRAIDELTAYGESQRQVLTQQLNDRKNRSVEKAAPWAA